MSVKPSLFTPGFARALRSRSFVLFWAGQTISVLGDSVFYIALVWQVLLLTNSATSVSIVIGAQMIPTMLFLLLGGVTADRLPRRLVLLCSDAGRAVVTLLLAGLGWVHQLRFWHFIVLALFFGTVDGLAGPSSEAIVPQLTGGDDLPAVNSLMTLSQRICLFAGPLLGSLLIAWAGPGMAFAFDAATFLFSALCLSALSLPAMAVADEEAGNGFGSRWSLVKRIAEDIAEGLRFVYRVRWLRIYMVVDVIGIVCLAAPGSAEPKLIHDFYGTGISLLGLLVAMTSLGVMLAVLVLGRRKRLERRGVLACAATMVLGGSLVLMGTPVARVNPFVIASTASVIYGIGMGGSNFVWSILLQERVPGEKLGRVSSLSMLCSTIGSIVGLSLGGLIADRIGPAAVYIACGLALLITAGLTVGIKEIRQLS